MIQKPFRLRSDAPKVTQSRTHGQSQLIMRQLQPLKLKPSLYDPSLRLSCHKIPSSALKELLESAFGHFSGTWRRLDSGGKHFQPSDTRGNIKLQRHTPEKTPSQTPPGQLPLGCRMDTQPTVHSPASKHHLKTPWRRGHIQKYHLLHKKNTLKRRAWILFLGKNITPTVLSFTGWDGRLPFKSWPEPHTR